MHCMASPGTMLKDALIAPSPEWRYPCHRAERSHRLHHQAPIRGVGRDHLGRGVLPEIPEFDTPVGLHHEVTRHRGCADRAPVRRYRPGRLERRRAQRPTPNSSRMSSTDSPRTSNRPVIRQSHCPAGRHQAGTAPARMGCGGAPPVSALDPRQQDAGRTR